MSSDSRRIVARKEVRKLVDGIGESYRVRLLCSQLVTPITQVLRCTCRTPAPWEMTSVLHHDTSGSVENIRDIRRLTQAALAASPVLSLPG